MRRREHVDPAGPPPRLLRYRAEEWPGTEHPAVQWWAARDAWRAAHGPLPFLADPEAAPDVPLDPLVSS